VFNTGASILRSWKDKQGYYFVDLYSKYQDKYVIISAIVIAVIFILGLIFRKAIPVIIILMVLDVAFIYALYLDWQKKLKGILGKYLK
jgi:hypothetical protein